MTLPVSGVISLGAIRTELNTNLNAIISINDANVRALLGKPSGLISLNDAYGKSSVVIPTTFNETVAIISINVGNTSNVTISGGKPNGTFNIVNTGTFADGTPPVLGPFTLDVDGNYNDLIMLVTNANQPVANSFSYIFKFTFNYGSSSSNTTHFKNVNITATRTVYTETVTVAPGTFAVDATATLTYAGGMPNGTAHIVKSDTTTLAGSEITLDANGAYTQSIILVAAADQTVASLVYNWTVAFSTGHTKPITFTVTKAVYTPVISMVPATFSSGDTTVLTITGGKPNGSVNITQQWDSILLPTISLNSNGGYTESKVWVPVDMQTEPSVTYNLSADFGEGQIVPYSYTVTKGINEVLTMTPTSFAAGTASLLSITGGKPNDTFTYMISGDETVYESPTFKLSATGTFAKSKIYGNSALQMVLSKENTLQITFLNGHTRTVNYTTTVIAENTPDPEIDLFANDVILLLNGEGLDIEDSSSDPKFTLAQGPNGDVATTIEKHKWGTSSIKFNRNPGTYIEVTPTTAFNFGTSDFTIDGWYYFTPKLDGRVDGYYLWTLGAFGFGVGLTVYIPPDINNPQVPEITVLIRSIPITSGASTNLSFVLKREDLINRFFHLAAQRKDGMLSAWFNGTKVGTPIALTHNFTGITKFRVGSMNNSSSPNDFISANFSFNGYIDKFRVTRAARYTFDFVPETGLMKPADEQFLLIPNSVPVGSSATFSITGGTPLDTFVYFTSADPTEQTDPSLKLDANGSFIVTANWFAGVNQTVESVTGDISIKFASNNHVRTLNYTVTKELSDINDLFANDVILLLNGGGVNGSTLINDDSISPVVVENVDVAISTAKFKHGNSSLYFNNVFNGKRDTRLNLQNLLNYQWGTNDFTIDGWYYTKPFNTSNNDQGMVLFQIGVYGESGGIYTVIYRSSSGVYQILVGKFNPYANLIMTLDLPNGNELINKWAHIAFQRTAGIFKIYLNGRLKQAHAVAWDINSVTRVRIGNMNHWNGSENFNENYGFNGWIDKFRITLASRYTGTFIPDGGITSDNGYVNITPSTTTVGQPFTITISDGPPNATFTFKGGWDNVVRTSPTLVLDGNGFWESMDTWVNIGDQAALQQYYTGTIAFNNGKSIYVQWISNRPLNTFNEDIVLTPNTSVTGATPIKIEVIGGVAKSTFKIYNALTETWSGNFELDDKGYFVSEAVWVDANAIAGPSGTAATYWFTIAWNYTNHTKNFNFTYIKP